MSSVVHGGVSMSPEEHTLVEQMGYKGVPENQLFAFLHAARTLELDPRLGEISLISRKSREGGVTWTVQVGINGYRKAARKLATKLGVRLEISEALWCGRDGQWAEFWLPKPGEKYPSAAKVTVWRGDEKFVQVVMWEEYVQLRYDKDGGAPVPAALWASKPAFMLAKCAESLAIRKAFPDFNGTYTEEEMSAVSGHAVIRRANVVEPVARPVLNAIESLSEEAKEIMGSVSSAGSVDGLRELWAVSMGLDEGERVRVQAAITARVNELKDA